MQFTDDYKRNGIVLELKLACSVDNFTLLLFQKYTNGPWIYRVISPLNQDQIVQLLTNESGSYEEEVRNHSDINIDTLETIISGTHTHICLANNANNPYTKTFADNGINVTELPVLALGKKDVIDFIRSEDMTHPIMRFTFNGRNGIALALITKGEIDHIHRYNRMKIGETVVLILYQKYYIGGDWGYTWGLGYGAFECLMHGSQKECSGDQCEHCEFVSGKIKLNVLGDIISGTHKYVGVSESTKFNPYAKVVSSWESTAFYYCIPPLDISNIVNNQSKNGSINYIDPTHMKHPVMKFVTPDGRRGLAFCIYMKTDEISPTGIMVLSVYQKYPGSNEWTFSIGNDSDVATCAYIKLESKWKSDDHPNYEDFEFSGDKFHFGTLHKIISGNHNHFELVPLYTYEYEKLLEFAKLYSDAFISNKYQLTEHRKRDLLSGAARFYTYNPMFMGVRNCVPTNLTQAIYALVHSVHEFGIDHEKDDNSDMDELIDELLSSAKAYAGFLDGK